MKSLSTKSLLLAVLVLAVPGLRAAAQQCGAGGGVVVPAGAWHWPAGTAVKVYVLKGAFNAAEREALKEATRFWDSAAAGAGLRFAYVGEAEGMNDRPGSVTVTRVAVFENGRHLAEIFPFFEPNSGEQLRWAIVRVDPRVTDREQLRSVFAHELAHTLGLGDCLGCARGTTIMAAYGGLNKGNGLALPSGCDVGAVLGQYAAAAPRAGGRAVREGTGK